MDVTLMRARDTLSIPGGADLMAPEPCTLTLTTAPCPSVLPDHAWARGLRADGTPRTVLIPRNMPAGFTTTRGGTDPVRAGIM